MPLPLACAMHADVLSCFFGAAVGAVSAGEAWVAVVVELGLPDRQAFMNALRSSPLSALVLASALQPTMRCCCAVSGLSAADAAMVPSTSGRAKQVATTASIRWRIVRSFPAFQAAALIERLGTW